MPSRECSNWLHTLAQYVEETETPRHFWSWAGIYILTTALERRVWLPYGITEIYPNLFIMIIAPPGRCRKSVPASFAKKILQEVQCNVFVDSPTKRALTKEMAIIANACAFNFQSESGQYFSMGQCPISLISKELSSFFAIDLKGMVEVLTDLFDAHDEWEYRTSDKGKDKIQGVCVSCFFCSTPGWIAKNLPEEAIGGGFTSRMLTIFGDEKYKFVPIPPIPNELLYRKLVNDLGAVKRLTGKFKWGPNAEEYFRDWYKSIDPRTKSTFDERIKTFLEREHILAIKTAMGLRVAYSDDLTITEPDIKSAISLVEEVESGIPLAFGSHGQAFNAVHTDRIAGQIKSAGTLSLPELLLYNYHHVDKPAMMEILDSLSMMKKIQPITGVDKSNNPVMSYKWIGKAGVKGLF